MAEVKLERDTLGWDPAQIKEEPDIKQEPEEFPFHTVKAEDDDDESPVLHLRPTEGEECGSGADSQEHSDSSDTDCSEDYSPQQTPAKRSYAMIPPDSRGPDSRPFICSDCGKGFKDKCVLQRHVLYVHRGERPHQCSVCGKTFVQMSALKCHMWVHTKESPHKCSVCEKSCRNKYELKQHLKNQHDTVVSKDKTDPESNHIPFSCLECGKTIHKQQDIMSHMRKHSGEKAFPCSVCNKDFGQKTALLRHRKQFHNICPVCSAQFLNKIKLNAHLRAHIKDGTLDPESNLLRDVKSFSYRKKFMSNSNLQSHMKDHIGQGSFQCSECGKRFLKEKTLKTHMKYHTGATPYTCDVCDEGFKSYKSLQRHVRTHTGHKPFACSVCDKAFGYKSALTVHLKSHCAERPFVCPACEKSFVQQRDLTQHQRQVHHICPICSLGFTGRSELKKHLSSHSETQLQEFRKPFACSECGKRFALHQRLQSHMTSHSEERPIKCSVCEKFYKNDSQLTIHMKTHRGKCSECGKKLKWKSLAPHLRNIHHIYACSVCKERFSDNVSLKEHTMTHVEKFHICSECGELFMWKTALLRHEREAHEQS